MSEQEMTLLDITQKAEELVGKHAAAIRAGDHDGDLTTQCAEEAIDHFRADSQHSLAILLGNSYELWWTEWEGENLLERARWGLFGCVRDAASEEVDRIRQEHGVTPG